MPIHAEFLKTYFLRYKGTITATFFVCVFSSCQISENQSYDYDNGDVEIEKKVDQISFLVDSLVRVEHPSPIAFLDSVVQASPSPGIDDQFWKYIGAIRYYSYNLNNNRMADIYADSTVLLSGENLQDSDFMIFHAYAILRKVAILWEQQLYGEAIQYTLQGWQMIDPEKTPCLGARYLHRLASISYMQENYRESIDFYSRFWQLSAGCTTQTDFSRFFREYGFYHNVASNYQELQMPDSAMYYNELALNLIDEKEVSWQSSGSLDQLRFLEKARAVVFATKAFSLAELGRGEEAERFWQESIAINERPWFDNEHAELTRLLLADYYVDAGRLEDAETALALTREWLDEIPYVVTAVETRWRQVNWKWFDSAGDSTQAYAAYRQYMELKEAELQNKIDVATVDVTDQVQFSRQQQEISQLQKRHELRAIYLTVSAIILVLAIVVIFLVWHNWRQSKKNVQELADLGKQVFNQRLKLEKSNKAITRIMNMVAHDLRNPLTGIKGISSMIQHDGNLTDEQKKWVRLMHDSSGHAMDLINEMMDSNVLGVLENRHKSIKKEFTDIRPYLKRCVDVLQFRAREKRQTIEFEELEESITVPLNRDAIFRVIGNLVGNAIKFSYKDSTIRLRMKKLTGAVLLSVQDNGIGIPDDLKEKVFDMFTEAKRQGTAGEQSFGLGLSISKQIVEAHEGSIWLESKEEKGTTVYIKLPMIRQHP